MDVRRALVLQEFLPTTTRRGAGGTTHHDRRFLPIRRGDVVDVLGGSLPRGWIRARARRRRAAVAAAAAAAPGAAGGAAAAEPLPEGFVPEAYLKFYRSRSERRRLLAAQAAAEAGESHPSSSSAPRVAASATGEAASPHPPAASAGDDAVLLSCVDLVHRGAAALARGDASTALDIFARAADADPAFAPAWRGRAAAHAALRHTACAREDLGRAEETERAENEGGERIHRERVAALIALAEACRARGLATEDADAFDAAAGTFRRAGACLPIVRAATAAAAAAEHCEYVAMWIRVRDATAAEAAARALATPEEQERAAAAGAAAEESQTLSRDGGGGGGGGA